MFNYIFFLFKGEFWDLFFEYKNFFGDRILMGLWKVVEEYGDKGMGMYYKVLDDVMMIYKLFKFVECDK